MMDNSIEWEIREVSRGSKRTVSVHGIRISRKRLESTLTESQKDAAREIAIAYEDLSKGFGYALLGLKTSNPNRIRGGELLEETIDQIRKRLGKLHEWEFASPRQCVLTVRAIEELGLTAKEYAERLNIEGVTYTTVADWYRNGLQDYVEMQGWE